MKKLMENFLDFSLYYIYYQRLILKDWSLWLPKNRSLILLVQKSIVVIYKSFCFNYIFNKHYFLTGIQTCLLIDSKVYSVPLSKTETYVVYQCYINIFKDIFLTTNSILIFITHK